MQDVRKQIGEIVHRETKAWDTQDADLLIIIFHPDMVWLWPKTNQSHDSMDWILEIGRYNYDRWKQGWQKLFDNYILVHNKREIKKIVKSNEGDGAFAVWILIPYGEILIITKTTGKEGFIKYIQD